MMTASKKARTGPLAARLTWAATQLVGSLSPTLATPLVWRLWFTPWRLPQSDAGRAREREWLRGTEALEIETPLGRLAGFAIGDGPTVLLVHGWGGWASRLGAFVHPLASRGYRVVGVDLLAHGRSAGAETNLFEIRDALLSAVDEIGQPHAVVSHSLGALVTLSLLEAGLATRRVAMVAPALRLDHARDRFAHLLRLRPAVVDALGRSIERRFGPDIWDRVNGVRIAAGLADRDTEFLMVHDPDDSDAPFDDARAVSEALPRARLVRAEGVGHHRILLDPSTIEAGVSFVGALDTSPQRQRPERVARD